MKIALKTKITTSLVFFSGILLFGAFAQIAFASHLVATGTLPTKCYDIKGMGKAVVTGSAANAGKILFDQASGSPLHDYEACVRNYNDTPDGPFRIDGWAWNDNLGWISFYCPPGAPGVAKNLGIDCSNATYTAGYGVTIDKNGNFSGYAWGDNTGWISFKNGTFSQVRIEAKNPDCQGFVYGATLPAGKTTCPAHGAVPADGPTWTHAWSDNVGWIDFDGIYMPWFTIAKKITIGTIGTSDSLVAMPPTLPSSSPPTPKPDGVTVQISPDPATIVKATAPVANDKDRYTVRVNAFNSNGEPLKRNRYTITMIPEWEDTVKMDQTTTKFATCNTVTASTADSNCAVTKPVTSGEFALVNLLSIGGATDSGIYKASLNSKAPTSSMNVSDDGRFSYESFILGDPRTGLYLPQKNNLRLKNVKISIKDNNTGECVFSDAGDCSTGAKVAPLGATLDGKELNFKPQAEITTLEDGNGGKDVIRATIGEDDSFNVNSRGKGKVEFFLGFVDSFTVNFLFKDNKSSNIKKNIESSDSSAAPFVLTARPTLNEGSSAEAYIKNPYLYTVITDSVTGAKYFSNKLPRVEGGFVINPVAILQGNIYSSGLTNPSSAQTLRSLGDISTNVLRNTVARNVSKIVAGVGDFRGGNATITGFDMGFTFYANVKPLLPDKSSIPTVYYVKNGDLTLEKSSPGDLTWNGARTLIVVGGNVYIKSNLYNPTTAGAANKPKLGIIVLKDLTVSADKQKQQGNVYIAPNVTNIQASIFADGSLFSYDGKETGICSASSCNLGEPQFAETASESAKTVLGKTQLLIEGSISSQNTVGGSLKDPPILGDGTKLPDNSQPNINRARLYDLNFLRWYSGRLKIDATGKEVTGRYTNTDGTPCSHDDSDKDDNCALYPPFDGVFGDGANYKTAFGDVSRFTSNEAKKNLGSVYVYFDAPSADLPGFGQESGVNQKQLQR